MLATAIISQVAAQPSSTPASGGAGVGGETRRQYDAAFAEMIANPGNLDKTFRFAELAVAVGDLEGAVSALERMLLINANLPRVRLELGVLYYRLGSFEAARTYLQGALAAPDMPPDVRKRAEAFLAEIDKQRSVSRFSGTVLAGIRYQSNANAAPTGNVLIFGIPANLDNNSTSKPDWNVFVAPTINHWYDMGTQHGEAWESRVSSYVARQFKLQEVDVSLVTVSSGPRFALWPNSISDLTIRPALAFDYVMLDDRSEYMAPGLSLAIDKKIGMGGVGVSLDWRMRDYHDSRNKPFNSNRDASELIGRISYEAVLTEWLMASAVVGYGNYDARASFESYGEWQFGLSLVTQFDFSPFVAEQKSSLVLSGTHLRSNYDAPDPTIDPTKKRRDRDWRVSLTGSLPLSQTISMVGQGGYAKRGSSLPNYEYTNWIGMMGLAWRF